jgi:hypothetical protein
MGILIMDSKMGKIHGWIKHSAYGLIYGLLTRLMLLTGQYIMHWQTFELNLTIFIIAVWQIPTIKWEISQCREHPITYNKLDGFIDWLFGNLYAWMPLLVGNTVWHYFIK